MGNLNTKMRVIGIMSGTSLDGLDIAFCEFEVYDKSYNYSILNAKTINYSKHWKEKLTNVKNTSAE